jgi:pyridinium-3,5-biscarboxylic acid mononucleotide sulfurtransferase
LSASIPSSYDAQANPDAQSNGDARAITDTRSKYAALRQILSEMDSVMVAYSGGVDSSFLLKVAFDVLGDRVLAVTANSDSYAEGELEEATRVAGEIGAHHLVVDTHELEDPSYLANPANRCYFCKAELWDTLGPMARERGIAVLVDGFNADDVGDFRPGAKAARERGVRSPLREAELGKQAIRALSRELGLSTWDKLALACLSSRVPYGEAIDRDKLTQIDRAERLLRELGFRQVRVRHHGQIARIELATEEIGRFVAEGLNEPVSRRLKELGFQYVTLDLEGYRTGSLNETLKLTPVAALPTTDRRHGLGAAGIPPLPNPPPPGGREQPHAADPEAPAIPLA